MRNWLAGVLLRADGFYFAVLAGDGLGYGALSQDCAPPFPFAPDGDPPASMPL